MADASPHAYLRTKVMTASPGELRLMLIDGAIRFSEQARTGLEANDFEAVYVGVNCTNPSGDPCDAGDSGCTCEYFEYGFCRDDTTP